MNIVLKKAMQIKTSSQNGKSRAMRTYAACGAFRHGTPILGQTAFAGSPKASWKWAGSSSAHTVAAGAALAEAPGPHPSPPWTLDFTGFCHPLSEEQLFSQSGAPGLSRGMVSTYEGFAVHQM